MSFDGIAERTNILARAKTLAGGRAYEGEISDDVTIERYPDTELIKPYIIVKYGSMIATGDDRSLDTEDKQPQLWPISFECWASTSSVAQDLAGDVRVKFLGFGPNADNATPIVLAGGHPFTQNDANGRPVRFMESVNATTIVNMSAS